MAQKKKGEKYTCEECGMIVIVEADSRECEECDIICCEVPMVLVKSKKAPAKKAATKHAAKKTLAKKSSK